MAKAYLRFARNRPAVYFFIMDGKRMSRGSSANGKKYGILFYRQWQAFPGNQMQPRTRLPFGHFCMDLQRLISQALSGSRGPRQVLKLA
jgi:hypothetical protein